MKAAVSLCPFAALSGGAIYLKDTGRIGEASFLALLIVAVIAAFIVFFQDRLKKASFKGEFELYEAVKEAKDAEVSVKALAAAMLEVTESNEGGFKQPSWDKDRYDRSKEALRKLIN